MPKKITKVVYTCDKCGEEYNTIDEATSCESRHISAVSIHSEKFKPDYVGYPERIAVNMDDGMLRTYCLLGPNK